MPWDALECPECKRVLFFDADVTDLILCGYGCFETWPVVRIDPDPNDEDEYDSEAD